MAHQLLTVSFRTNNAEQMNNASPIIEGQYHRDRVQGAEWSFVVQDGDWE